MTPDERAWNLGVRLGLDRHRCAISDEIRAAIEEEREACAKIAWEFARLVRQYMGHDPIEDQIRAAIRARGDK